MKSTIDGKTYNTVTANFICDTSNKVRYQDFSHEQSALYVTKKGAYFLAGEGGPASRFAKIVGNGRHEGRGIIPLSAADALSECKKHGSDEEIKHFFGDIVSNA